MRRASMCPLAACADVTRARPCPPFRRHPLPTTGPRRMKDPDPSIGPAGRSVPDPAPRAGGLVPRAAVAMGDAPAPLSPLAPQRDADRWPDAWLVAAARREPPDAAALDALVARHWGRLYARCELLTLDRQAASDLAQE